MRVVTWNVGGGSETKIASSLADLRPDILVAPACCDPAPWRLPAADRATSTVFIGVIGQEGLRVLAYGGYKVRLGLVEEIYDQDPVRITPIVTEGPGSSKLLAVWADNRTLRPALEALAVYQQWLSEGDVVIAGDFNDGPQSEEPGIGSAGPCWRGATTTSACSGPTCTSPTSYMYRRTDRPYVVDHVFVPSSWLVLGSRLGTHADRAARSDHVPVSIEEVPVVSTTSARSIIRPEHRDLLAQRHSLDKGTKAPARGPGGRRSGTVVYS